jgi:hypothetical protein
MIGEVKMNLAEYFEKADGIGVLATSDKSGNVDIAMYAKPHVVDENTIAFIMRDRLSHNNVLTNPKAAYLFKENVEGYHGKRLYLTMISEETDPSKIAQIRCKAHGDNDQEKQFLVNFRIDSVRPLVGD